MTEQTSVEKQRTPDWRLIKLDERAFWSAGVQAQTTEIFGVYAFDAASCTHLCELTPSYCLYFIDTDYSEAEHVAENEDARNDLNETIRDARADNEPVMYMHVRSIEQIASAHPVRMRKIEELDLNEHATTDEQVNYIAEQWATGAERF
jgi:hypothetical protein